MDGGTRAVDLAIVGAGPTGLFAAYYAGFRGLSTVVIDALPEPGGQVTAMYPEKMIYDVAGFPAIRGRDLVHNLDDLAGQNVVIVGGGDSAFDWALSLQPIAKSVTLVHRRDKFRAHAHTVSRVQSLPVVIIVNAEVRRVLGDDRVEGVEVQVKGEEPRELPADTVVAALGFTADLGPLTEWGLDLDKRHILVDSTMATNRPRIFAAGDIAEYPGKVRLIATGFGEAATAVNNAAIVIDPSAHLFPGHSSDNG